MKDEVEPEVQSTMSTWRQNHRLIIMITGSIVVSFFLVLVSMSLYKSSGAAQLDLSRPGYSSIRDQAQADKEAVDFSSTGAITAETLDEFKALYDKKVQSSTAVDAFGGDVLSDSQLGIDDLDQSAQ